MNNFDFLKHLYLQNCETESDINQHLPVLHEYATRCEHVTEMGARTGLSTVAFLLAKPNFFVSYDYQYENPEPHSVEAVEKLKSIFANCQKLGQNCKFIGADVLNIEIEPTDLLFIDTWHCYEQLKQELNLHASKVKKYLIFHDTFTYGEFGEKIGDCDVCHPYLNMPTAGLGIRPAINEFIECNPNWRVKYETQSNNGLIILENMLKYSS